MSPLGFIARVVVSFFAFAGFVLALACFQSWLEGDFDGGPPEVHGDVPRVPPDATRPR